MADITVDEAIKRNADALIAGNVAQLFMDMTPQAMAKLSQQATAQGMQMGGPIPKLTGYAILSRDRDGDDYVFDIRFEGDVTFSVKNRWREIDNQWKLVDFEPHGMRQPGDTTAPPSAT